VSKSTAPDWVLSDAWAVSRDKYNWILQARKGVRLRIPAIMNTDSGSS